MDKRNALIVGAGGMGRAWGRNLRDCDAVRVVGWVDPRPAAAEQAAAELGFDDIAGSLRDFLHALETGATPMGECHDNVKSLAMVFGAIESAATGLRVRIAP